MHHDPVKPPSPNTGTVVPMRRARVVRVAGVRADVRFLLGRGSRVNVIVVDGLTVDVDDVVLLSHIDGDPTLPVILHKLPAGALGP